MGLDDSFHEGLKAYREGRYQEAVGLLNKSVTAHEKNHKAWNALGVTYAKMGRVEDALTCYENALKYDPGNLSYEQNRDQIVKKAYKQIPLSKSAPPAELNLNYGRFLIPAVMLLFIVACVIYVVFTPSFLGGTHTPSPTGSTNPVPMNTSTENLTLSDEAEPASNLSDSSSPPAPEATGPQPALVINGDMNGKYTKGLSELSFSIVLTEGNDPQYLPRVTYLWSVGSLDPITVLPANPASGTIKPGDEQLVNLQIPSDQQPRAGEEYHLEIRPPTGLPANYNGKLPDEYRGGVIANPSPQYVGSSIVKSLDSGGAVSNLAVEGSLTGFYAGELQELSLTLREQATGSPQDMNRITYLLSVGEGTPVEITRIQPVSGTINPGEQQLVTLTLPEESRPRGGDTFTLEIKPDNGPSILVRKVLSSAYKGGIIP